jgi:mercuric ion binding protein
MKLSDFLFLSFVFMLFACSAGMPEHAVEAEFKVWGNCGMCKKTIETSLKDAPGVFTATWNKDTKMMTLVYDTTKTDVRSVQEQIATSGYDTELSTGNDKAYANLHECCKYERKK